MAGMSKAQKISVLFSFCILAAFIQGWIVLKSDSFGMLVLPFGILGAIPFMMLNGVHGDAEGASGVVGGILYVFTNGAVYFGITAYFLRLRQKREDSSNLSLLR